MAGREPWVLLPPKPVQILFQMGHKKTGVEIARATVVRIVNRGSCILANGLQTARDSSQTAHRRHGFRQTKHAANQID